MWPHNKKLRDYRPTEYFNCTCIQSFHLKKDMNYLSTEQECTMKGQSFSYKIDHNTKRLSIINLLKFAHPMPKKEHWL